MLHNVIYINEIHTTINDYNRFGCEFFANQQINVEIWDLNNLIFGNLNIRIDDMIQEKSNIINTFKELKHQLSSVKYADTAFVFIAGAPYRHVENYIKINIGFRKGKYYNCFLAPPLNSTYIMCNNIKENNIKDIKLKKINSGWILKKVKEIPAKVEDYIVSYLYPATLNFAATKRNYSEYKYNKKTYKKRTKLIHTIDYDKILEMPREVSEEHIVFIDEGFGIHPDDIRGGQQINNQMIRNYYQQMIKLFEQIEKKYASTVLIAAHPRVKYQGFEYGDRQIIYFDTINLVRKAKLVIMHFSTAMSFVAWYKKPCLVVANFFMLNNMSKDVAAWEKYWKITVYNIQAEQEISPYNFCDINLYNKYISDYIKVEGTPEKKFFECVEEYINI